MPGLGNHPDLKINRNRELSPWEVTLKNKIDENEQIISQKYYQWVCIMFCFQALFFYIPRYLWKTWEGGRLRLLVRDLGKVKTFSFSICANVAFVGGPIVNSSWNVDNKERLINYFTNGQYCHNLYAVRFAFCEILNFFNVVCK